jgi:hypothetical protein
MLLPEIQLDRSCATFSPTRHCYRRSAAALSFERRLIMRKVLMAFSVATLALGSSAFAQEGAATGAAGGAVTGAIVGGPVGAAVGGVAGAVIGDALTPPPAEVRTYVVEQNTPSVQVERQVVVGEALPETVEYHVVPGHETYAYTVVNDQRVIVDPRNRTVVQVLD